MFPLAGDILSTIPIPIKNKASVGGSGPPVPPSWTPASPTTDGGVSPHTWVYAEAGLYEDTAKTTPATDDGDSIAAWENQGSDTSDFTQATGNQRPTLRLNIINGLPAISFDGAGGGVGDNLFGNFGGGDLNQPRVVFLVAKLDATADGDNLYRFALDGIPNTTGRMVVGKTNSNNWGIYAGAWLTGGNDDSSWHYWTVLFNGESSQFWIDGSSIATGNAGTMVSFQLRIGGEYNDNNWKGYISEILIYASNLSANDRAEVESYLSDKYQL